MTAWPPLLVLTIRTFFLSAAMALTLKEQGLKRLEVVTEEWEIEREDERVVER